MGQVSPCLRSTEMGKGKSGYSHWCPACLRLHYIQTQGEPSYQFNGNLTIPTFSPAVNVKDFTWHEQLQKEVETICHYYITNGVIIFQNDCSHALRSQKYPLPQLPEVYRDEA